MHMLDGLAYDFQACGEFVLLRSGVSGLEVQTRLQPWAGGTSVNTEIALKAGTHVVSINLNDPACDPSTQRDIAGCVKVDHLSVDFRCQASDSDPRCLKVFPLPGVGSLEEHIVGVSEGKKSRKLDPSCDVRQGGAACLPMPSDAPCVTAITLRLFTGEVIESCLGPGYINLRADLPLAVRGLTSGLLGNADGDPTNDLVPQGSSVPLAVSTTYEQFYRGYGDSWRVSAESSMLTPLTGQPQACSSSVFQLSDLSPAQVTHGTQLCQDLGINAGNLDARITDVALIGDSAAYGYVGLVAPQAKVTLTGSFVPGLGDSPGAGALNTLGANAFGDDPTRGANAVGCGGCGASGSGPSAFIFAALALALVAMSRRRAV